MAAKSYFRQRNSMLLVNMLCNLVGVVVTTTISPLWSPAGKEMMSVIEAVSAIFTPATFVVGCIIMLLYESPVRSLLHARRKVLPTDEELLTRAQRRCLNEPYFAVAMDFSIWLTAAIFFTSLVWQFGAPHEVILHMFFLSLFTGLITSILAFFSLEKVLQKVMIPVLFPHGNLFDTPGVIRIRIGTRLAAMLIGCNIIPFLAIIGILLRTTHGTGDLAERMHQLSTGILLSSILFMVSGFWLTFLVKGNLTRPLKEIISVLNKSRRGDFNHQVPVTSNDELGYTGEVINQMNAGLKERDRIKDMFGRYVTSEIRDAILSEKIPLDGEVKEVTILFCDLRDFTALTASLPPKEVVEIINRYFTEMEAVINRNRGLVIQFLGDEIEAAFGAPIATHDHALWAVQAAIEMSRSMARVNEDLKSRGFPSLRQGIGIHTGGVVAANIGSPDRRSYALVGETVNLAARLQDLNKVHGTEIIVSGETKSRVENVFSFTPLPRTNIKGINQHVPIFSIASELSSNRQPADALSRQNVKSSMR